MNLILIRLQHNFDFHMDHNSDMGTNVIGSTFNSDIVVFRWQEIIMHYILDGEELWIPCIFKADTPNGNLHSNIECT